MKRSGKKRGHLQLVETAKRSFKPSQFSPGMVMDIMVGMDGPRAAAWIVRAHRRSFHRSGLVSLSIPLEDSKKLPPWFRIGIECLKRRKPTGTPKTAKWRVVERQDAERKTYVLFWLGWGAVANG